MPSVYFTQEHEAFREGVRRFLTREVAPHAAAWEAARRIPRRIFLRMAELGYLGITAREEHGGAGGDLFHAVAFLEELPRSRMGGFCAAVSVQQFMATSHIARYGTKELAGSYVTPSVAGRKVGALAITEPDTGSDVAAIRTSATREGDSWVIRGSKTFVTNGADGDFFTVAVRTGSGRTSGISLIVVDADTPGVRVARRLDKLGWHSSDTAEIVFDEVRVPAGNLVGLEGHGFAMLMESFRLERLAAAAIAVGTSEVTLETTLSYMSSREVFGRTLDRFQVLRHRLADLGSDLEAARQLTYHATWLLAHGHGAVRECSMAKLVSTELGKRVADECLQFFGGYGFMEEYPAARFYRDARAATITAGTSEVMREIIAKVMVDGVVQLPPEDPAELERRAVPADPEGSVETLMRSLPERLRSSGARGWNATFHYRIQGAHKPEWTVSVDRGACRVDEGLRASPDCVVEMSQETYLGLEAGTLDPRSAFLSGRVKVSNLGQMIRFIESFRGLPGP